MPTAYQVDKTVEGLNEIRSINGQEYLTITQAEGRKLMQRIPKPSSKGIDRVLAKGKDETLYESDSSNSPDFILIEAKNYKKSQTLKTVTGSLGQFLRALFENTKLQCTTLPFYQALAAEFIGTMLLTLVVCSLGIRLENQTPIPDLVGALGGGLTVATIVWIFNSISGGNVNPAISIALMATGKLNILRGVCYIFCQLAGSISGAGLLKVLIPRDVHDQIGLTLLAPGVTLLTGFGVEFIITFVLALTVFACIDSNRKDLGGSYPLAIGFSVIVGASFGGQFTGASMNPARSFGPAVVQGVWTHHWIYWFAPIIGCLTAALFYKVIFKIKKNTSD